MDLVAFRCASFSLHTTDYYHTVHQAMRPCLMRTLCHHSWSSFVIWKSLTFSSLAKVVISAPCRSHPVEFPPRLHFSSAHILLRVQVPFTPGIFKSGRPSMSILFQHWFCRADRCILAVFDISMQSLEPWSKWPDNVRQEIGASRQRLQWTD